MEFVKIEGVPCEACGKIHDLESKTFIAFHGNVTLGKDGGIYGNKDNTKISVFCIDPECMTELLHKIHGEVNVDDIGIDHDKTDETIDTDESNEADVKIVEKIVIGSNTDKKDDTKAFDPKKFT